MISLDNSWPTLADWMTWSSWRKNIRNIGWFFIVIKAAFTLQRHSTNFCRCTISTIRCRELEHQRITLRWKRFGSPRRAVEPDFPELRLRAFCRLEKKTDCNFRSAEVSYGRPVMNRSCKNNFEFTEATTIRIFLTLRSVEEKSTDSTVRECKKK